jgi:uncharacterized protein YeeX (DUF496 family)
LDEAHEAWRDKLENLEMKGVKQKDNLKDKVKRDISVLETQIEKETHDRDRLERDIADEDRKIQDLQIKLRYATSYFQSIQDNINLENRAFTECLDKLKKDKEQTATKQVHIQSSL